MNRVPKELDSLLVFHFRFHHSCFILPGNNAKIEKRLWDAGDELRANSKLKSSESSVSALGLTLLCYAGQGKDRSKDFFEGLANTKPPALPEVMIQITMARLSRYIIPPLLCIVNTEV